jgi:hypothetical protein
MACSACASSEVAGIVFRLLLLSHYYSVYCGRKSIQFPSPDRIRCKRQRLPPSRGIRSALPCACELELLRAGAPPIALRLTRTDRKESCSQVGSTVNRRPIESSIRHCRHDRAERVPQFHKAEFRLNGVSDVHQASTSSSSLVEEVSREPRTAEDGLHPRAYCRGEQPMTRLKALIKALSDS